VGEIDKTALMDNLSFLESFIILAKHSQFSNEVIPGHENQLPKNIPNKISNTPFIILYTKHYANYMIF